MEKYERPVVATLVARMKEPRRFIQILLGPRQTGKTTALMQALAKIEIPYVFGEAERYGESADWLRALWYRARNRISPDSPTVILAIDEVQYLERWSETVKALWDEDARLGIDLRVVLTGSASTILRSGMKESLMGRFELIRSTHWTYAECKAAFGYSLEDFLFFGGYPGAASLTKDATRWNDYITNTIIEPSIAKDIVALEEVRKPELLRRLFYLGAPYSGQELSFRKILGQLDDKGNAATIAHYLELLNQAGLMSGIQKYDAKLVREKASSPRLLVHNTALMTATYGRYRDFLLEDPEKRGHLMESAVGAYLIARGQTEGFTVNWWRDGNDEVDFVISNATGIQAIEVKSGRIKSTKGLTRFAVENPECRVLIVGSAECPTEEFFLGNVPLL